MASTPAASRALSRRGALALALGLGAAAALLYVALPAVAGLDETWRRLQSGESAWLVVALALECLSYACYVAYFRAVFTGPASVGWLDSYRITMAGVAATRLFAAAGAGGIALMAWALRRRGLARREVASHMAAFYVLLYAVYMGALVLFGVGLYAGVLSGGGSAWLTLAPAAIGALAIVVTVATAFLSDDLDPVLSRFAAREGRRAKARRWLAALPATVATGVRGATALIRSPTRGLAGGLGWWAFDIAVLWASMRAFGDPPALAVIVMAYFVGMLANTIPVPGGVGTVDGGMIAALVGFGVNPGYAIVSVLSYRAFAFWLPVIPGAIAYLRLLREPRAPKAAAPLPRGQQVGVG